MTHVFVVMGMEGEYSDRTEWPVAAYLDRAKAEQHVTAVEMAARAWEALGSRERDRLFETYPNAGKTALDMEHSFNKWETDTRRYWMKSVELKEEVPT